MPTAPKKTTATRKAPADRKPKVEEVKPMAIEETPGWELMKPIDEIPIWDQTPLISLMYDILGEGEDDVKSDAEVDAMTEEEYNQYKEDVKKKRLKSFDINSIGVVAKALLPYSVDEAKFTKFVSGKAAMQRTMDLMMAWVGQMGESESSVA